MRRVIALLAVAVVLLEATPSADTHDGNWWLGLGKHDSSRSLLGTLAKQTYIAGIIDGSSSTINAIVVPILKSAVVDQVGDLSERIEAALTKYVDRVTPAQIQAGLDTFFDDFKNRRIRVSTAVFIVLSQIAGTSDSEVLEMTMRARKNAGG